MTNFLRYLASAGVIAMALGSSALAQPGTTQAPVGANQFVPFNQFMANTSAAAFNSAAMANAANADVFKVANDVDFKEMRQHVIDLYQGVHVTHSFVQGSQTYDCIPVEQQPSLRTLGLQGIAAPPAAPAKLSSPPSGGAATFLEQFGQATEASPLSTTALDGFGNATACEDHTVPIQRTTVEQMSRFPTLRAFLSKSPDGRGMPPVPAKPGSAATAQPAPPSIGAHFHDLTYQYVYNLGGSTHINIWNPHVYTFWGQIFSLSQVWYQGFTPTFAVQSVEAGWQVFPGRLGDSLPHLFVYYTADGYNRSGCYDHSCSGFVQYSSRVFPGGALAYSQQHGNQTEATTFWEFWFGNWWLGVNGEWVGYYPGSLFGNGEMATHSSVMSYGGEIIAEAGNHYGNPNMGSGYPGDFGFGVAAYQRNIWYFDGQLGIQGATLTSMNECPTGTTIVGPNYDSTWGTYFFFGGIGGSCP